MSRVTLTNLHSALDTDQLESIIGGKAEKLSLRLSKSNKLATQDINALVNAGNEELYDWCACTGCCCTCACCITSLSG